MTVKVLSPAEIEALDVRWSASWTPGKVARRLAGTTTPWYVAGGWALELFLGRPTREHENIEIAKDQADFDMVGPQLTGRQRERLAALLAQVYPGHPWLAALES